MNTVIWVGPLRTQGTAQRGQGESNATGLLELVTLDMDIPLP